jgi:hypothetical protein
MNRFDYSNLGGQPIDLDHLNKVQQAYNEGIMGIAKAFGDKVILSGVDVTGSNVSDGFITYNGEVLRFVGGALNNKVLIIETPTSVVFEDSIQHEVEFIRYATCAISGDFYFADLQVPSVFQKDDIKEVYCLQNQLSVKFDSQGYGKIPKYRGWRILSYEVPDTAGRVFVNFDHLANDVENAILGQTGGQKDFIVTKNNIQKFSISKQGSDTTSGIGFPVAGQNNNDGSISIDVGVDNPTPISNKMPFFVILKLIKI